MAFNFDNIASSYDRLNHMMTWGIDRSWRRKAVAVVADSKNPCRYLDIATGTGDLALDILHRAHPQSSLVGVDLSEPMMQIAKEKLKGLPAEFSEADAEALPFAEGEFDCVTVSFGVRNFVHVDKCLCEMNRVLKSGGILMILELSYPDNAVLLALYKIYALRIIPILGSLFAGNRKAYEYLPHSILHFPKPDKFIPMLKQAGFVNVTHESFTFGTCRLYVAQKNAE